MVYLAIGSVIALTCLSAICYIVCLLYSKMLCPHTAQGTWAVVWGRNGGEELEQRVRCLVWLQSCGLLRCAVLVVDDGLDARGRALAVRLAQRYPGVSLYSRQMLERRLPEE